MQASHYQSGLVCGDPSWSKGSFRSPPIPPKTFFFHPGKEKKINEDPSLVFLYKYLNYDKKKIKKNKKRKNEMKIIKNLRY